MKKTLSLIMCSLLIAMLSLPVFASTTRFVGWCSCGGRIDETVNTTSWIGVGFVDCTHGKPHAKDSVQERTVITSVICSRCGEGTVAQAKEERYYCYAPKSASLSLPEGSLCPICSENAVVVKTNSTSWLTTETDENGISTQERIVVKTSVCGNCGQGGTTNETETRTIRLHKYQ